MAWRAGDGEYTEREHKINNEGACKVVTKENNAREDFL
jgi:hypothetical protein